MPLFNIINGSDNGNNVGDNYVDRIKLFFFFVACAGVSIIVWIFNWVCWINQCCCCDFLHNPINKRIAWWMSFTFLLGILACCISAFVSVNRFGFAIEGTWCALDRIYYDIINGQLTENQPKWSRMDSDSITLIKKTDASSNTPQLRVLEEEIKNLTIKKTDFKGYKEFIDGKILNRLKSLKYFQITSMVYFCLFLITVTFAGVSLMFYACLKRQGYLFNFMIVLWNIIRFFILSFFLFGTAYGIFYLIFRGSMSIVYNIFKEGENESIKDSVFSYNNNDGNNAKKFFHICSHDEECEKYEVNRVNCCFINWDINLIYRALNDVSSESEKLCALSLCSALFGEIVVTFFLLVLHHYNNEIFFDSGKSIFKGFNGFGGGYKKRNIEREPAYKKRKLRAEIELTSKNEETSIYKDINKNGNDDD